MQFLIRLIFRPPGPGARVRGPEPGSEVSWLTIGGLDISRRSGLSNSAMDFSDPFADAAAECARDLDAAIDSSCRPPLGEAAGRAHPLPEFPKGDATPAVAPIGKAGNAAKLQQPAKEKTIAEKKGKNIPRPRVRAGEKELERICAVN